LIEEGLGILLDIFMGEMNEGNGIDMFFINYLLRDCYVEERGHVGEDM
jgi:hypothetical protein